MKRKGQLYHEIAETENLKLAFWKASRGKRGHEGVLLFRENLDANINLMRGQLLAEKPDIGHYHFFKVYDPKERLICAASFPERVLHHAIMNICEPIFERYAIFDNYACRTDKGNRKAIARCQYFSRLFKWYLKLDIRQYFASIDHVKLLGILERLVKDRRLLDLFASILATYNSGTPGRGLPIGNLVSQHLANLYLGKLDHWIRETLKITGYLRYMDDFVLFSNDRQRLQDGLSAAGTFLGGQLSLALKENIQLNRGVFGIPFLGFRVFPSRILLSPSGGRRFARKYRQYMEKYEEGEWNEATLSRHLEPLVDFTRIADSIGLRRKIIHGNSST